MLLLSGDISLNPGPVYNNQSLHSNEWGVFRSKGIYLIHLHVNSLIPKIEEIRYIAEHTKAAVIGITEFKLDKSIFQSETQKITTIYFDVIETETVEVLRAI